MNHSIDDFWRQRLAGIIRPQNAPSLPGWGTQLLPNPSFVEADLRLRPDFDDTSAPIRLVAPPGAVWKSTLAKEIAAQTGAAYLDLANADTVAGNYLTGGLVKNDLLALWREDKMTVLIDALDEARLRVTQDSFEDFLRDIKVLSLGRKLPTVLFGRVGIVEEAWLALSEHDVKAPIFDIDFFDTPRAERFVMAALNQLATQGRYESLAARLAAHQSVYQAASTTFVHELADVSASDGARFAGYAPVLEAVATDLAAITNPANLTESVNETMKKQVLRNLSQNILDREARKMREQLDSVSSEVKSTLYSAKEQLGPVDIHLKAIAVAAR